MRRFLTTSWRTWVFLVFVFVLILRLSFSPPSAAIAHELSLAPNANFIDLGTIKENNETFFSFELCSTAEFDVHVLRIDGNCACTKITPQGSVSIPKGGRARWQGSINLDADDPKTIVSSDGSFGTEITANYVDVSGKTKQTSWPIQGRVERTIRLKTKQLDWGQVSERSLPLTKTVIAQGTALVRDLDFECPEGYSMTHEKIANKDEWIVHVTLTRSLPVGPLTDKVAIIPIDALAKPLPAKSLTLRGRISPDLISEPPSILLRASASKLQGNSPLFHGDFETVLRFPARNRLQSCENTEIPAI